MLMDTGATYTHLPLEMYTKVVETFVASGCTQNTTGSGLKNQIVCKCIPNKPSANYPRFTMTFGKNQKKATRFEYAPDQYFIQTLVNRSTMQDCLVMM